jgi:DNA-binding transcriptional ArsR family regulator
MFHDTVYQHRMFACDSIEGMKRLVQAEGKDSLKELVKTLAALSEENRFRIIELLLNEGSDLSCGEICKTLGISASLLSHHLTVLESAGLIDRHKNGSLRLNRLRRDEMSRRLHRLDSLMRAG